MDNASMRRYKYSYHRAFSNNENTPNPKVGFIFAANDEEAQEKLDKKFKAANWKGKWYCEIIDDIVECTKNNGSSFYDAHICFVEVPMPR